MRVTRWRVEGVIFRGALYRDCDAVSCFSRSRALCVEWRESSEGDFTGSGSGIAED